MPPPQVSKPYAVAPAARRDIIDITSFVARDNPAAATRLAERIFASFDRLAGHPFLGHRRDDLIEPSAHVRFWRIGRYLVVYRTTDVELQIVRVLSGFRDIGTILGEPEQQD